MLFACNAVDGTARVRASSDNYRGNAERFKAVIREEIDILEVVGLPGVDLRASRFPYPAVVSERRPLPDIADVLYHVHRCAHGHGHGHGHDVVAGFELQLSDLSTGNHTMHFGSAAVQLPQSVILGLVAIAVLAPENESEQAWDAVIPWLGGDLAANDWWARGEDFRRFVDQGAHNRFKLNLTPLEDPSTPLDTIVEKILRQSYPQL